MLIYRVEKKDGTGPWCSKDKCGHRWHSEGSYCFPNQRSMDTSVYCEWREHKRKTDFVFGFPNLLALFRYTRSPRDPSIIRSFNEMKAKGYFIVIYEVLDSTEIFNDNSQLVFLPDKATLVRRISPTSVFIATMLKQYILSDTHSNNASYSQREPKGNNNRE